MAEKELYVKLSRTAEAYIYSCLPQIPGGNEVNSKAILANLSDEFRLSFGHSFFVATKPHLQGERTGDGFISHLLSMAKFLKTWNITIKDVSVDPAAKSAVVRADYRMVPPNGEEVLNDIILWMNMDESGMKLLKCTEFVDPVASMELARRMKAGPSNNYTTGASGVGTECDSVAAIDNRSS